MRKFNIKTPFLYLILLCLVCLVIISSTYLSTIAARFVSSQTINPSANAAKIDFFIDFNFSGYGDLGEIDGDSGDVYAVMEEFVAVNNGEIDYKYTLKLRMSRDVSGTDYNNPDESNERVTISAPKNLTSVKYVYHASEDATDGSVKSTTPDALTGKQSFVDGRAYYAISFDGVNYTWYEGTMSGNTLICTENQELKVGEKVYYKIIYFIEAVGGTKFEQMALYYAVECEQIS